MTTADRARRPLVVGLALAALYLVAAVVTLVLSDRPFRPLFDGLAPPAPYRWVNPPREAARDNQQPVGAEAAFPLGPEGSPFINVTTTDGQLILLLEDKAVPPNPPETGVGVTVTPLDVHDLGPVPDDQAPQSNAYRVEVAYAPSGLPVTDFRLDTSSIALVGAGNTDVMLFSRDAHSWEPRSTTPLGATHGLETKFAGAGYYVVTSLSTAGGGGGTSPVVIGLVLLAPPLLVGGLVLRRRRARTAAEAAVAAKRRAQPRKGGPQSKRRRR